MNSSQQAFFKQLDENLQKAHSIALNYTKRTPTVVSQLQREGKQAEAELFLAIMALLTELNSTNHLLRAMLEADMHSNEAIVNRLESISSKLERR